MRSVMTIVGNRVVWTEDLCPNVKKKLEEVVGPNIYQLLATVDGGWWILAEMIEKTLQELHCGPYVTGETRERVDVYADDTAFATREVAGVSGVTYISRNCKRRVL